MKQQLGFRANTDPNMKNSRSGRARWKRFDIADHIEKLKSDGFKIDDSQTIYQIADDIDYNYKIKPVEKP